MKSNIIKIIALFALMLVSCTKADLDLETHLTDNEESVEASLSLSVDAFSAGTAEALSGQTRAIGDDEDPSTTIKNLWVIQVNGTTDNSKIVASQYIGDYSSETAEIKFIPSSNYQTVICLANTFRSILRLSKDATLADVKAIKWNLKDDDDYCYTDDGKKYMYMSGTTITQIQGSDNIKVNLKRSIAKINFTINNIATSNLIITAVAMNGVPEVGNYYVNRDDLGEIFPLAPEVYNYTAIEGLNITAGNNDTFTFYIPTNKQGKSDDATSYTKPYYAPTSASYITVVAKEASATDSDDVGVYRYTFYLGADLENDYNIEPNKEYTYNVNFKTKGSVGTDWRIKDLGSIDWRNQYSSNCYILNPVAEANRVFYIPVEERINEFWGDPEYGNNDANIITEETDWSYEVLWYDCDTDPITTSTPTSSTIKIEQANNKNGTHQEALKVTLGRGFNNWGNVVVAVKDKDANSILWSWHLWLTDYDPDSHIYASRKSGAYRVDGGEIHRYDGELWTTGGVYADKFIMDRPLGARNSNEYVGTGAGTLYYQWGSKNPIPGTGAKYKGDYGDGTTSPKLKGTLGGVTFATVTENPTTHYYIIDGDKTDNGYNWCKENASLSTSYFWNDYNSPYNSSTPDYSQKSIFDPSPLGWKLPINGTWDDFDSDSHTDNNKTVYPKFPWENSSRTYNRVAYYPASGDRSSTNKGALGSVGGSGHYWSATPSNNISGYFFSFNITNVNQSNNRPRSYGFPVRPIKE